MPQKLLNSIRNVIAIHSCKRHIRNKRISYSIGVSRIRSLDAIWYQQYVENSSHGWHIHDGQFTGVYYLELPKSSPKTEFIHPFSNNIDRVRAKEGDVIFFPSHVIHRAPTNNKERKTIISYNFNLLDRITKDNLENIVYK